MFIYIFIYSYIKNFLLGYCTSAVVQRKRTGLLLKCLYYVFYFVYFILLQIIILISYIFLAIKRVEKKVDNISDAMTRMESYLKCRSDDNGIVVRNVQAMQC